MCELSAGQFRASGTRRQLDGRVRCQGRGDAQTGRRGAGATRAGRRDLSARQGAEGSSTLFQKVPTQGPARETGSPHVTVHWPPSARSNDVPGPEGSSVRDLGLGHHQQPAVAFMVALGMEAEVAARTGDLAQGFPFGAEIMGGVARNPQRCTLGRPRPTSLPSPCWGPQRVRDGLGGPLTPSRGKSRPSEEGEGLQPGPEAATRLGTWNQKPARVGRPQLGGTP